VINVEEQTTTNQTQQQQSEMSPPSVFAVQETVSFPMGDNE
jgi:hypothetical protein